MFECNEKIIKISQHLPGTASTLAPDSGPGAITSAGEGERIEGCMSWLMF